MTARRPAKDEPQDVEVIDHVFPVVPDGEVVAGLIRALSDRAGADGARWERLGIALMQGYSRNMACVASGLHPKTLSDRCIRDAELSSLVQQAETIGFGVFEQELYRRAMAGKDDRGSVRALELVVRARGPEYREKINVQHERIVRAEEASARALPVGEAGDEPDDGYDSN